jgi:hypothetical protein
MPPEIAKELDEMAEQAIDDWTEQRHAHEIVKNEDDLDDLE